MRLTSASSTIIYLNLRYFTTFLNKSAACLSSQRRRLSHVCFALVVCACADSKTHLTQPCSSTGCRRPVHPAAAALAAAVSASLSTRQTRTALQHDGPNHLGLWSIRQHDGPNHLGLWPISRRRRAAADRGADPLDPGAPAGAEAARGLLSGAASPRRGCHSAARGKALAPSRSAVHNLDGAK